MSSNEANRPFGFCWQCGEECAGPVPEGGRYWKCASCDKRRQVPREMYEDRERFLLKCLRSGVPEVYEKAQRGFPVLGLKSFDVLVDQLFLSEAAMEKALAVVIEMDSRKAAEIVMERMSNVKNVRLFRVICLAFFLAAMVAGGYLFMPGNSVGSFFVLGLPIIAYLISLLAQDSERGYLLLGRLGEPVALPRLLAKYTKSDAARSALQTVLPNVTDRDAADLRPSDIFSLNELASSSDGALAPLAIRALGFVGNEGSLNVLQAISLQGGDSANALERLTVRLERKRESKSLLRATDHAADDPALLLRAGEQTEVAQEQLLRRAPDEH